MREFINLAEQTGNTMTSAGIGLEAIGNMLGADGSEHCFNAKDMNGLHHAVVALGDLIKGLGYDLAGAAEESREGGRK